MSKHEPPGTLVVTKVSRSTVTSTSLASTKPAGAGGGVGGGGVGAGGANVFRNHQVTLPVECTSRASTSSHFASSQASRAALSRGISARG